MRIFALLFIFYASCYRHSTQNQIYFYIPHIEGATEPAQTNGRGGGEEDGRRGFACVFAFLHLHLHFISRTIPSTDADEC